MHREKSNPLPDHKSDKELANQFNQFFKEKNDKIRDTFFDEEAFEHDIEFAGHQMGIFNPITLDEMKRIIRASKPKSCDLDPIPTDLLKSCTDELAPIICRIVNLSLEIAIFPKVFKCAIVKPLIKNQLLILNLKITVRCPIFHLLES